MSDFPGSNTQAELALSVVIPVYNGADSIGELVGVLEALDIPGGHEIVLVYDGSPDNSLEVCRGLVERAKVPITLIELARNFGEHNAVMAGLRHTRGAHVINMDDDLQNPPEEVARLLAFAQESGRDVIYTYYDEKQHARWRNLGSQFTNWVAGFVLVKPKNFYLSSFRCMNAFVVREITRYDGPFPYVDGLILQVTQNIDRMLVRHLPRAVGRSNYTLRRLLRLWTSMFVNFSVMPLRVSTLMGFALSLAGGAGGGSRHHRRAVHRGAAGLGLAVLGAAAAVRGAADDPRHRRRVSRAHVPHRQPQAAIGGAHRDPRAAGAGSIGTAR